jgi:hypothetical protein
VPVDEPVTDAEEGGAPLTSVATDVVLLIHVPVPVLPERSASVMLEPTHTVVGPLIGAGEPTVTV